MPLPSPRQGQRQGVRYGRSSVAHTLHHKHTLHIHSAFWLYRASSHMICEACGHMHYATTYIYACIFMKRTLASCSKATQPLTSRLSPSCQGAERWIHHAPLIVLLQCKHGVVVPGQWLPSLFFSCSVPLCTS